MRGVESARQRLAALEKRLLVTIPQLPPYFWQLRENIRQVLENASQEGLLRQSMADIKKPLFSSMKPDNLGAAVISGGIRAETWAEGGQFERNDGARFNFSIVVSYPKKKDPTLTAYHFNLAFAGIHSPIFVRFDLNEGKFVTPERNTTQSPLLCHSHPGHGDMTVPSPVLSPEEILDIILREHLR